MRLARAARIIEATAHSVLHPQRPHGFAISTCGGLRHRGRHSVGIRHEYLHLVADEPAFWKVRNAFYQSMLAKPRLFATDYFRERLEEAARSNMRRLALPPLPR